MGTFSSDSNIVVTYGLVIQSTCTTTLSFGFAAPGPVGIIPPTHQEVLFESIQ